MKKFLYLIISIFLITVSCTQEDFEINNTNSPDVTATRAEPSTYRLVSVTNHENLAYAPVSLSAVFFRLMSDQMTSTNNYLGFWWFSDEPRRTISNTTNNEYLAYHAAGPWSTFNSANITANGIIKSIEVEDYQFIIDDVDLTNQVLAGAYFDKALALGYISYIYDKGYIVNYDTDVNTLEFSDYNAVLDASIQNFNKALELANDYGSNFDYEVYGQHLDLDMFKKLANSYMARFAIGVARTDAEAQNLDYSQILGYANNAITEDYFPPVVPGNIFYNNYQDWSLYVLGDGSGYLPSDIKIQHLFNPTGYPATYPTDTTILDPVVSADPRTSYYEYVGSNFGYLNADRGRHLFSSYRHVRYWDWNDEASATNVELIPKAEMDYIKAECKYRMGDYAGAVQILDGTPRMTVGNQSTTPAKDNVRNALFYENSIELDMATGMAVNWSFMRRHDLLQKGTPTSYPVPADELEIIDQPTYTFGSESMADQPGTAAGQNDWTTISLDY